MKAHCKIEDVDVIAPNFKQRLSGVTSTIVQLVPLQAKMGVKIATLGPGLPSHLPFIRFRDLWRLWKRPNGKPVRIWHARRNVEMVGGVLLRDVLRMPLKLVFTSDAQRRHKAFTRFLIRQMNVIIACSTGGASFLEVPYTMIMHGVDTNVFSPHLRGKVFAKAAVNLNSLQKYIGCFGRVRHQKGTDLFVDAMVKLLPRHPDWTAIICGRVTAEQAQFGKELEGRVAAAGLSDRIVFLGEVSDILPYFQAVDLYVGPSRNEGFGLTPLEAMSCGVPVVTSDAGAYADMVVQGVNGAICSAGDGPALIAAISDMLEKSGELEDMGKDAIEFVHKHFDLEDEAAAINAVYASLLSRETTRYNF